MKVAFAKIANQQIPFEIADKDLKFSGILKRINPKIIECVGNINGKVSHLCDRCGADMFLDINENVDLNISQGIFNDSENILSDTIEFFGNDVDLDEIFKSEVEAFKSEYFYCNDCKNL